MHRISSMDTPALLHFFQLKDTVNILCFPKRNTQPKLYLSAVPHYFYSCRLPEMGRLPSSPALPHSHQNCNVTKVRQVLKEFAKSGIAGCCFSHFVHVPAWGWCLNMMWWKIPHSVITWSLKGTDRKWYFPPSHFLSLSSAAAVKFLMCSS